MDVLDKLRLFREKRQSNSTFCTRQLTRFRFKPEYEYESETWIWNCRADRAFVRLLVPTAGHLQLRVHPGAGHLSISCYYPRACRSQSHRELKRPRPRVSFVVCQNGRLLNTLNKILYYIIVECWFSSVNQCLRFSFSPYYIYCIYNEKLSAIKASVSRLSSMFSSEMNTIVFLVCFFVNSQKNS
jgi:hypothetical protein